MHVIVLGEELVAEFEFEFGVGVWVGIEVSGVSVMLIGEAAIAR